MIVVAIVACFASAQRASCTPWSVKLFCKCVCYFNGTLSTMCTTIRCVMLQELGHCEIKNCNWAHGVDDLDTSAFAYDFPQAQGSPQGEWAEVAKLKLGKVKTGPSSLNGGNK